METLVNNPKGTEKNNENYMSQENSDPNSGTNNSANNSGYGFNACTESDSSHYSIGGDNGL